MPDRLAARPFQSTQPEGSRHTANVHVPLLQVGKEKMHFRPPEEQNEHKITCGVNVSVLQQVLDSIQQSLDAAGVQSNIITSGTGKGIASTFGAIV